MDFSALFGLVTSGAGLLSRKRGAGDAWQTAAETYGLLHKPSTEWVKQNYGLIFLLLIFVTLIPFLLAFLRTIIRRKTT
jgi:hypothetical protein